MKRLLLALLFLSGAAGAQTPLVKPSTAPGAQTPLAKPSPTAFPAPTPFPAPKAFVTPTPKPATKTIAAATYRALLQGALDKVTRLQKRPSADVRPALKPLDTPFLVKRADGQSQKTNGDEWNQILSGVSGTGAAKMPSDEMRLLRGSLQKRLQALDDWTTPRAGNRYYASFDAQKIVDEAVAKGRIRVGPPPLERFIASAKDAVLGVIGAFFKWLGSLFPKTAPAATGAAVVGSAWLGVVFWGVMIGLLGFLLFLAVRALAGGSWGAARRAKSQLELRDEDAALFGLAPEELRDRADNFAAAGNFREAVRHRFISILVLLDARGTWRYDIRRTNWEHIAGLRREEAKRPLVAPLSDLTRAFDRVRYGGGDCDESGWTQFQSGVRQVEALVGGRAVAK